MEPEKESISVAEGAMGLSRGSINEHGQIKLVNATPHEFKESAPPVPGSGSGSGRSSFTERRHETAVKVRKILHISKDSDGKHDPTSSILANSIAEPSYSRLDHDMPERDSKTVKEVLRNPVTAVKDKVSGQSASQAAARVASQEISHGQAVDLIRASDQVKNAKSEAEKINAAKDVDRLIKERQTTFVRWTVDRHVSRCRVLPRDSFVRRNRHAFRRNNDRGETIMDWHSYATHQLEYFAQMYGGQYIGAGSDPPAPSKDTIMPNVERIIIASAPLQEFIMKVREVYRWEDRRRTTRYLVIYLVLWYMNFLLPGVLIALLYLVVHRYYTGETIEDVRAEIKRTEDINQTAYTLTEYIDKEGAEVWADKIIQAMGPWLMVQLCDMANMFEVMRNFYEWRVPSRTLAALGIFSFAMIFTFFAPAWFLVKSMTLAAGFTFFGLFPLASNYPEYRLLTSIPKRIFWDIPTHAEWAFISLQAEGSRFRHSSELKTGSKKSIDYGFYNAHYDNSNGRLIISTSSIRFETNVGHRELFTLRYDQINNLDKIQRQASKNSPSNDSGNDLRIRTKAEDEFTLVNVDGRDQAYSQIVGFSDTRWQIVW